MNTPIHDTIEGRFRHLIYSPRGEIEGVLMSAAGRPLQIVFERDDEASPAAFDGVREDQLLVVEAAPQGPSPKGGGEHPVYAFGRLKSIDGATPARRAPASGAAYRGRVVRFNYARHGAANGVVLDTGDFIHTRPEGLAPLKLAIGDAVEADGDAQMLVTGSGWAVEAVTVNGQPVKPRKAH